jgi:two-component system cell cycle sensor histidine kinase/response regulator CckA
MSTATKTSQADHHEISQEPSLLDKAVLEMIMAQQPLSSILESLCLKIEEKSEGLVCSVLLLDSEGTTLLHGAAPNLPQDYIKATDGIKIGPRVGSCGTAAYRRQPVVVIDIAQDPLWDDFRSLASLHGLRACWSMPISSQEGAILGTFACYYREPRSPDAYHLLLIDRATRLAGIAIEHHRTRKELQAAETRYRTLVERLPAITYMAEVGVQGRWFFVSPQIETMLGYTADEWMADPALWMSRIHNDDQEIALEAEKRVQETGELYKAEYRMCARDGRILWFRDEGKILTDIAGAKPVMQGVLYDITEYKRLEEQLRQSQKMEAVGQLAGGVAHDFNNLLMIIEAHSDRIVEKLSPDEPTYADAVEIRNAVARAASLTQRLLAFGRKQLLQPRVLDLPSVLNEIGSMIRRLLVENIEMEITVEPGLSPVKVDRSQLEQAILNLTVNARDAMPQGGKLTLCANNASFAQAQTWRHGAVQPGNYVVLSVTDSGIGMNAETQSHIFEPFFTTKEPGKGTGLGLSAVYGMVQQSGGAISVESDPNRGSNFKLFLPACEWESSPDKEPALSSSSTAGTETILLVEDQAGIREVANDYLLQLGYNVLIAADGEAAMQVALSQNQRIDLLITDVVMPRMGGRALAARLLATQPTAKVLFISGYPDSPMPGQEDSIVDGEILRKPFSLKALASKARWLLDAGDEAKQ